MEESGDPNSPRQYLPSLGNQNAETKPPAAGSSSGRSTHGLERKRERDRIYRQKRKEGEKEMKSALGTVGEQNEQLKQENDFLREYNASIKQTLQGNDKVVERLKAECDKLKLQRNKENALVHTLFDKIACTDDVREENKKLREENLELRERKGTNDEEVVKLIEEIAKLRLENATLLIQKDALCRKILLEEEEQY